MIVDLSNTLKSEFKKMLDEGISALKDSIIEGLKASNDELKRKVKQLEEKADRLEKGDDNKNIKMEKDFQAALQYDRLNSIVVSGIPQNISDELLENKAINILYTVNTTKINHRDIEACHRLGREKETLIKFVNRKDAEQSIENRTKLANFNRVEPGFDPNVPIYINQHLTSFISKLAFY